MSKLTKLKEMTSYLKDHAQAREGKNRYKALVARARRKYNFDLEFLSDQLIENIIFDGLTDNRLINRVQQLNEELRGSDYDDESKKIKEQEAKTQLDYSPGYNQDISKLKTLYD